MCISFPVRVGLTGPGTELTAVLLLFIYLLFIIIYKSNWFSFFDLLFLSYNRSGNIPWLIIIIIILIIILNIFPSGIKACERSLREVEGRRGQRGDVRGRAGELRPTRSNAGG